MPLKRITIPYQDRTFEADVANKNLIAIIKERPDLPPVADIEAEAKHALSRPIESEPISKLAGAGSRVAVLIDDYTRATPTNKLAPILIEELESAGVKDGNIFFVYAPGQHQATRELAVEKIGKALADRFEIVVHNPKAFEDLVFLGFTSTGTPVWVNMAICRADFIISIGGIKPNFSPGWGGGCKIVMPGISGWETINYTHTKVMASGRVNSEGVDDTPVRCDIEEIGDMAGLSFILNVVWNRGEQVCGVVAGDPHKAWKAGLETAKKSFVYRLPERADIAVIGAGKAEYIYEALYAATKGYGITKENGSIVVVAPCAGGWGKDEVPPLDKGWYKSFHSEDLMRLSASEIAWKTQTRELDPARNMNGPYGLKLMIERRHVLVASQAVSPEKLKTFGVDHAPNLSEALTKAYAKQGADARVTIVPRDYRYVFRID